MGARRMHPCHRLGETPTTAAPNTLAASVCCRLVQAFEDTRFIRIGGADVRCGAAAMSAEQGRGYRQVATLCGLSPPRFTSLGADGPLSRQVQTRPGRSSLAGGTARFTASGHSPADD